MPRTGSPCVSIGQATGRVRRTSGLQRVDRVVAVLHPSTLAAEDQLEHVLHPGEQLRIAELTHQLDGLGLAALEASFLARLSSRRGSRALSTV